MLGAQFARGRLLEPELVARLLTPTRLLDVLMRRSLSPPQVRCLRNGAELQPRDYIAVGVSTAEHLAELVAATSLHVDHYRIAKYRSLLHAKALATEAS
jgi:hypothetical protein